MVRGLARVGHQCDIGVDSEAKDLPRRAKRPLELRRSHQKGTREARNLLTRAGVEAEGILAQEALDAVAIEHVPASVRGSAIRDPVVQERLPHPCAADEGAPFEHPRSPVYGVAA
jgi:hypothetical protein